MNKSKTTARFDLNVVISEDIRIYFPDGSYILINENNCRDKFINKILKVASKQIEYLKVDSKLLEFLNIEYLDPTNKEIKSTEESEKKS